MLTNRILLISQNQILDQVWHLKTSLSTGLVLKKVNINFLDHTFEFYIFLQL